MVHLNSSISSTEFPLATSAVSQAQRHGLQFDKWRGKSFTYLENSRGLRILHSQTTCTVKPACNDPNMSVRKLQHLTLFYHTLTVQLNLSVTTQTSLWDKTTVSHMVLSHTHSTVNPVCEMKPCEILQFYPTAIHALPLLIAMAVCMTGRDSLAGSQAAAAAIVCIVCPMRSAPSFFDPLLIPPTMDLI